MGRQTKARSERGANNPDELMTMKRRDFEDGLHQAYQTAFEQGLNAGMGFHNKLFDKYMLIMGRVNSILHEHGLVEEAFEIFRLQMDTPIYTETSDNYDQSSGSPDQ